jgi:hypothetical protein
MNQMNEESCWRPVYHCFQGEQANRDPSQLLKCDAAPSDWERNKCLFFGELMLDFGSPMRQDTRIGAAPVGDV